MSAFQAERQGFESPRPLQQVKLACKIDETPAKSDLAKLLMITNSKIAIIGFGKLGQALANILEKKKESCRICSWDIVETGDPRQVSSLNEAVDGSSVIFFSVPSKFFREATSKVGSLQPEVMLVSCTKGFDGPLLKFPFEVLKEFYPRNPIGVISGPMLSEELEKGLPTRATIACDNPAEINKVIGLFSDTKLALEPSGDLVGVSFLGILKNVYALALGLSDGLQLGSNFKSCLTLQSLQEMESILLRSGGKKESLISLSGISDFLASGYDSKSRNYSYGFKKAKDESLEGIMAEGATNIEKVIGKIGNVEEYALLKLIKGIFVDGENPKTINRATS